MFHGMPPRLVDSEVLAAARKCRAVGKTSPPADWFRPKTACARAPCDGMLAAPTPSPTARGAALSYAGQQRLQWVRSADTRLSACVAWKKKDVVPKGPRPAPGVRATGGT